MCDVINSACLMANVFSQHSDSETFELRQFRAISITVQSKLQSLNVMVEWTRPSVMGAFECYSDMFVKKHGSVHRAAGSKELFSDDFVKEEFNAELSEEIVDGMKTAISSCV